MYIENIVIGKPMVSEASLFAVDETDWEEVEKEKTIWTNKRNIAEIMKDIGMVKSISEVRRNKPQLCAPLTKVDFIEVKWGKKKLFVAVGE